MTLTNEELQRAIDSASSQASWIFVDDSMKTQLRVHLEALQLEQLARAKAKPSAEYDMPEALHDIANLRDVLRGARDALLDDAKQLRKAGYESQARSCENQVRVCNAWLTPT